MQIQRDGGKWHESMNIQKYGVVAGCIIIDGGNDTNIHSIESQTYTYAVRDIMVP